MAFRENELYSQFDDSMFLSELFVVNMCFSLLGVKIVKECLKILRNLYVYYFTPETESKIPLANKKPLARAKSGRNA